MKTKSVLIILPAKNFNEAEFNAVKEALNTAGIKIFIASDTNSLCVGSNGLKIKPDVNFFNMKAVNFDGIVIIGGSGIKDYQNNLLIHKTLTDFENQAKPIGAICAAPILLARANVLSNGKATCFPEYRSELEREGVEFIDSPVVLFKKILTGRDFLSADEFASAFVYLVK